MLLDLMARLDAYLTQRPAGEIQHNLKGAPKTLREWADDTLWYLSDGGYSRVVLDWRTLVPGARVGVFLASESTDRVRARWESAGPLIDALEEELTRQLRAWEQN